MALGVSGFSREVLESCALWKEIARNVDPILDEVVDSLPNATTVRVLLDEIANATTVRVPSPGTTTWVDPFIKTVIAEHRDRLMNFDGNKAALWRRCALSRSKALSQEPSDVPEFAEPGLPYPSTLWTYDAEGNGYPPPYRYHHKPLKSYSYLLDIEKFGPSGNKKCTVFLEEEGTLFSEANLCFAIPNKYLEEYVPWWDDYKEDLDSNSRCKVNTTFTVYAIDRSTGKHAKIYHSGRDAEMRSDYWQFSQQCCGHADNNPVPYLRGDLIEPWEKGEYAKNGWDMRFELYLDLYDPDNDTFDRDTFIEDTMLFLEKVCVYV